MPFRTSKSAKSKSAKNRLSTSLEDTDYLSEEEISVFGEEDIILIEYEDIPNSPLKKGNKSKKKKRQEGPSQKNQSDAFDFQDIDTDDDHIKVAEAIVIDFDTPTRKLVMESRVNLKKLNMRQLLQLKGSLRESSCRSTKLKQKKRKVEAEEEEEEEEEEGKEEEDKVSSNIARLIAKRSQLSHKLVDQRTNSNKIIRTLY